MWLWFDKGIKALNGFPNHLSLSEPNVLDLGYGVLLG